MFKKSVIFAPVFTLNRNKMEKRLSVMDFNRIFTRGLGTELFSDENLTIIEDVNNLPFWRQINQVDFALVILCKHGRLEATLNNVNYTAQAGDMIFCSGMHTMTEALITTDFDCDLFCISMRKYQELVVPDKESMSNFLFAYQRPLISLNEKEMQLVEGYKRLLQIKNDEHDTIYSGRITDSITQALVFEFMSACERRKETMPEYIQPDSPINKNLAHDFLILLSEDRCQHRSVFFYADKLCVSSKYLSHIVKKETGKTVSKWIKEQLTEQIRNLLLNTSLSCKEIAMRLGFPNTSFFGKFTKEHLGCSPMQYRSNGRSNVIHTPDRR